MRAWVDLGVMTLTFVLSVVWNLEAGIVTSMILSLLLVVHRSSKTRMTILGRIPGTDRWKPLKENPEAEESSVSGVLIVRIRENLDFGEQFLSHLRINLTNFLQRTPRSSKNASAASSSTASKSITPPTTPSGKKPPSSSSTSLTSNISTPPLRRSFTN